MEPKKSISRELWAVTSIAAAAAFVLCGYEFLRASSNVLYKAAYGVEKLPVVMGIMPLAVITVLYGYGWLLSRLGPRRTLFWTSLLSGVVIFGCYLAIKSGSLVATAVLYLFREAYIVLLIEQYWSFINSTLEQKTAKKANGPITGLASLGAITGGFLVYQLAELFGTANMLLFTAASLLPAAFLADLGYAHCGEPKPTPEEQGGKKGHLGLSLFKTSPMLILLLLLVMTTQIVSATLDLSFQTLLQDVIPNMDQQTAYQGRFFGILNGVAALLQFIATPLLLSLMPMGVIYIGIPLIHFAAITMLILTPSLQTAATAYLLFKAFDYSLFRAAKEILYIPLSFDARYRAKEVIDVFGYRFSKGGSSLVIALIQKAGIAISGFYSWIGLGAAALWIVLIIPIIRHLPARKHIKEWK